VLNCGPSSTEKWQHLYSEARLQLEQGYLSKALEISEEGFRQSDHKNREWNWKFRLLKAEILLTRHEPNEVLHNLASPLASDLSKTELAVRQEALQAMAQTYLGQYAQAEAGFKRAEELASSVAPHLLSQVALYAGSEAYYRAFSSRADSLPSGEQYAVAEQKYQLSLQLARQYQQPYIEVGALVGLAITATVRGHFDEGIDRSFKSLDFAREHQFRLAENYAINNLAWSYEGLGDLENAVHNFVEEVKILDKLNQPWFSEHLLNNLGEAYLAQGNYAAAQESFLKAVAIAQELQRKESSDEKSGIVFGFNNAAAAAMEEDRLEKAREYSRQAAAINPNDPLTRLISAKIEAAGQNFTGARTELEKLLADEATKDVVRLDTEDALANVCAAQHQNEASKREFEKLIGEVEAARSNLHVTENRLAFSSSADRYYDDYVRFLVGTGQKKKAFQVAEFSRARTLEEGVGIKAPAHPQDIRLDHIQSFLRQHNEIVLAYWLAPKQSYVWLISSNQFRMFPIAPEHEISQQVAEYNKLIPEIQNSEELNQKGDSLYQSLVAPMQNFLPKQPNLAKLVIIPDGDLNKLNFDTLRISQPSPHYWIEDVEIQAASSTTLLINSHSGNFGTKEKLLLVGDPIQASPDYPKLTHAAEELKRVENHFSGDDETVFSGQDATPSVYLSKHPEKFTLIHFVTHGTASELHPLDSAIILSPAKDNSFKLYARDIVKIPIRADMVTISACYGAGKRAYTGEGLVGLAWAFMRAGAHQVVAGLWDVDDRASVDLMDDFYTQLSKTKSASAALRAAKLKMLRAGGAYRLPYYWASLQLYSGS
jgi:CHAT domain-containing protein